MDRTDPRASADDRAPSSPAPVASDTAPAIPPSLPQNGHAPAPSGCTTAQLRRFIKSRPYVPMHELRRRFELNGEADEVSAVDTADGVVYLGLPVREAMLIGDLVRQGDVGLELCRDPRVPIVVGVFPMRPIARA